MLQLEASDERSLEPIPILTNLRMPLASSEAAASPNPRPSASSPYREKDL